MINKRIPKEEKGAGGGGRRTITKDCGTGGAKGQRGECD